MAIFEVYADERSDNETRAEGVRFLKDRVSIFALIVPLIWLLWHRLWLALAAYLVFSAAIAGLGATSYASAVIALSFLPGVYLLLEGHNLIADKWEAQGYQLVDLVEADSVENAELRWLARQEISAVGTRPTITPEPAASRKVWPPIKDDRPEFGLFSED